MRFEEAKKLSTQFKLIENVEEKKSENLNAAPAKQDPAKPSNVTGPKDAKKEEKSEVVPEAAPVKEADIDGGKEPLVEAEPEEKKEPTFKEKLAKAVAAKKQQVKNEKLKAKKLEKEKQVVEKPK